MSEIILYTSADGAAKVEVHFEDETFWLSQRQLAELFDVDRTVITRHLGNIFDEGELDRNSVSAIFAQAAADGKTYQVQFYALDAIIAVGYRVNSKQATRFRIWATNTLKEFVIKGFVLDDERLKLNKRFGKDYFDELVERIREIRASERRFYLKITDLYEQASIDYDPKSETTKTSLPHRSIQAALAGERHQHRRAQPDTHPTVTDRIIKSFAVFDATRAFQVHLGERTGRIHRAKAAHQSALAELDTLFAALQNGTFARGSS